MSSPAARPVSARAVLRTLWSLATPARFAVREPSRNAVTYTDARRPGVAPLADVYLPEGAPEGASVLLVHGGGFLIGSRRMKPVRFLATRLAEAGIAVAAFDYRRLFRGGRLDEALADVAAAGRWWRAVAGESGLDRRRVHLVGLSAGATLALLHGATADPAPAGIVAVFGVTDFAAVRGRIARATLRRLLATADAATWTARSPVAVCTTPVPTLVLHGDADAIVPVEHAERLRAERERRGLPIDVRLLAGAPHAFFNDPTSSAAREGVEAIVEFVWGSRRVDDRTLSRPPEERARPETCS